MVPIQTILPLRAARAARRRMLGMGGGSHGDQLIDVEEGKVGVEHGTSRVSFIIGGMHL
jgi:hypothetical protein